jgi:nucleoside-diphosphate-sugar epimerase
VTVRVLITGTEGYLGCLTAEDLMRAGHEVLGVDTGYYKYGWLYPGVHRTPQTLALDIRTLEKRHLDGVDAVVHMAELSNDPIGDLIGDVTYDINHHGSVHVAATARAAGVERFIYMSSCSVYGVAGGTVDESSPVSPQTAYARCKALVERDVSAMTGDDFSPTFLRNATAFGASPRMRFDIVLNNLAGLAWTAKKIAMTSDGTPWRPLVHALDIAKAIRMSLETPRERVHGQIFNVGSDGNNYQVRDIAEIVAAEFPGCELTFGDPSADNRSYRVAFERIRDVLPGYDTDWDAKAGAAQLHRVFASIDLDEAIFAGRGHTRLKQIEYLMRTQQVDPELYWVAS